MVKKLFAGAIGALSILGLSLPFTQAHAINYGDYIDWDYPYGDGSVQTGRQTYVVITDEEVSRYYMDNLSREEDYFIGFVEIVTYEATDKEPEYQETKYYYPASYIRKTNLGIPQGERDPNEFNDELQGYLKDLIGNAYTVGVSYTAFTKYINFLKEEHGMYDDEAEKWLYEYREYNNCLTDEDKAKIEADKKAAEERRKQYEEDMKKAQQILQDNANNTQEDTLYIREANMLERSLPDYVTFDRELFLQLRIKGLSYTDACQKAQKIDYAKAVTSLGKVFEDNKGWFDETYKELQSASVQEAVKSISDNIGNFLQELMGGN